ncbi:MAG TPA: VWA domain-containing protein [Cyclobacteriaceae bacterium]|nr:VWA domain-containing protein [Cyclobacteriaceae bacterium]MCB9237258.1 VWA domain-containing protein [Flammeovirgaceae bacterium]MCB0499924.1 VWA domain-containing protein [Cyclobacteriaceae bacterium]MCO5270968.1 VWA domain-containing protein [Cyclobacteriaceae bacterium]MCW5901746.1 VWA domain-containing protein [Cyclobacteriaceae bacterium]
MLGYRFSKYAPPPQSGNNDFDRLLKIFMQLVLITSGNVAEALQWLTEVDRQYKLTDGKYGMGDFIEDLKEKGIISEEGPTGEFKLKAKGEQDLRKSALEEIFGKLKKSKTGEHKTHHSGQGDEATSDRRAYEFGDTLEQISITDSIKNAQINHGLDDFRMTENDLEVMESEFKTQTSTVLMIDISHSMILYGEDRITPAKKVAMALAELITKRYPKDTLDILVFGNDAWQIEIKDLPYLKVGPYHTNTVAGLELAMDILRRRKNANKQVFMITDGKPTCVKKGIKYYKNSFGLDPRILKQTLNLAGQLRKLKIPVTTFMIATDPYLKAFVREFTRANNGNAYYSSLQGLGNLVFEDFRRNRRKNL